MVAFTERAAIKQRMADIQEERRELSREFYTLMDRLRELDSEEKESFDAESVIGNLAEAVLVLRELVPNIPTQALIERLADKVNESGTTIEVEKETADDNLIVPAHIVHEQQYRDSQRHILEKPQQTLESKRYPKITVAQFNEKIIEMMKEKGRPMKVKEMRKQYEDEMGVEILPATFQNKIIKLMKDDPQVSKAGNGYYQYQLYSFAVE